MEIGVSRVQNSPWRFPFSFAGTDKGGEMGEFVNAFRLSPAFFSEDFGLESMPNRYSLSPEKEKREIFLPSIFPEDHQSIHPQRKERFFYETAPRLVSFSRHVDLF